MISCTIHILFQYRRSVRAKTALPCFQLHGRRAETLPLSSLPIYCIARSLSSAASPSQTVTKSAYSVSKSSNCIVEFTPKERTYWAVNCSHHIDLMISLYRIVLINTQRVDPDESPPPAYPGLLEEIPDILPHWEPSSVDQNFSRFRCRPPGIRQRSISGRIV